MQSCALSFVEEHGHRCSAVNVRKLTSCKVSMLYRMVSHRPKEETWKEGESGAHDREIKALTA